MTLLYKKTKNKYICAKEAQHQNTYKLFYDFEHLMDITLIPKYEYNRLLSLTKPITEAEYLIAPIEYMKFAIHDEICRPYSSARRWEKIYIRLKVFDRVYFNNKKKIYKQIENIKDYLIPCKNPFIVSDFK